MYKYFPTGVPPLHHPTSRLNFCWLRHNHDTAWRRCSRSWRALKDLIRGCSDGGQPVRDAGQLVRGLAAYRVSSGSIRVFLFQLEKGTTASFGLSLQDQRPAARSLLQTTANHCKPDQKNTPTAANHASHLGPAAGPEGKHSQPSQPTATAWEPPTRDSWLHRQWIVFKGPCLALMPLLMAVEMHEPFRLPNKRIPIVEMATM